MFSTSNTSVLKTQNWEKYIILILSLRQRTKRKDKLLHPNNYCVKSPFNESNIKENGLPLK